jgi:hypothetical protein
MDNKKDYKIKRIVAPFTIFIWLILGLYFGPSSLINANRNIQQEKLKEIKANTSLDTSRQIIYNGIIFANYKAVQSYVEEKKYVVFDKIFVSLSELPEFMILIVGTCFFGLLGAVIKILFEHIFEIKHLHDSKYIALPVLGLLSGFISIGISYLLPSIFLNSKELLNPVGIILFSLLFGFFIKEFIEILQKKLFNKN